MTKNTTDANRTLALALLEIAQEMDKGDKADVRWLLDCSATLYAAAAVTRRQPKERLPAPLSLTSEN